MVKVLFITEYISHGRTGQTLTRGAVDLDRVVAVQAERDERFEEHLVLQMENREMRIKSSLDEWLALCEENVGAAIP